jgi:hypothetical protein
LLNNFVSASRYFSKIQLLLFAMNKETILAAFSDMPAQVTLDEVVE